MRIHVILTMLLFVTVRSFGQLPHSEIFTEGTATINFTADKAGNKYSLKIGNASPVLSDQDLANPYVFFYNHVKKELDKQFGNNPLLLAKIESFAINFARASTPVASADNQLKRTKLIEQYKLFEFQTRDNSFVYALTDTSTPGATPINILYKTGNQYTYNTVDIAASSFIKDNMYAIDAIIKSNTSIKSPVVTVIRIGAQDMLYFENPDGTTATVNITPAQAKTFKQAVTNNKTSAAVKAAAKKDPVRILDPQAIACQSKTIFELTAFTYPGAEGDSLILEINTTQVRKTDSIHQKTGLVEFKRIILNDPAVQKLGCADSLVSPALDIYHARLTEALKAQKEKNELAKQRDSVNKFMAEATKKLENRIDALAAEKGHAARLVLRNDTVMLNVRCDGGTQQQKKGFAGPTPMHLDSIVITVFNNLIYQIDIAGRIDGKPIQTISNNNYGIGLRELIDRGNTVVFNEDGQGYSLCFNQLTFVRTPDEEGITYTIADGTYTLIPQKQESVQLPQKRLLDFISSSFFLDLQAFNQNNPNKNLLSELYFNFNLNNARLPGKLFWQRMTLVKHAYTSLSLATNIFKEPTPMPTFRKRELVHRDSSRIDTATVPPFYRYDSVFHNRHFLKNFDLVRYSFLQIKPLLNVVSMDFKEVRTFLEFNAGIMLMGSNARIVDPTLGRDSITSTPVYSYSELYEIRARVNPKPRYGIDFHFAYVPRLRLLNNYYQSITGAYEVETLVRSNLINENKTGYFQGELNFFFNPRESVSNTDRGGLYFKLNVFKATRTREGYFMFLVGYSSDIKNFFK